MAVSMKEIAKEAGVSVSTVSRVLNNVSKGKRDKVIFSRIMQIAKDRNYRVNAVAQALRKGGAHSIGFVCPSDVYLLSQYTGEILKGAVDAVSKYDYDLSLSIIPKEKNYIVHYQEYCNRSMARGILLQDWILWETKRLDTFFETNIPFVLINSKSDDMRVSFVDSDNYAGAYKATEYLIKLGHKRIMHLHGYQRSVNAAERLEGYKKALEDYGLPFDEKLVTVHASYSYATALPLLRDILTKALDFSAVFATNDEMAVAAIRALEEKGLSVPRDVAVIGFDDLPIASTNNPRLTTVRQNVFEIGRSATEILVEIAEGKRSRIGHKVILPTDLVIRDSA